MGADRQGEVRKIELPASGLAEDILGKITLAGGDYTMTDDGGLLAAEAVRGGEDEEEALHLVGFMLGSEEYALDISQVQEIIRVSGWTRVPNAPDYIKGVINLRGRIIPVVDPKVRMKFERCEQTKDTRIIVVEAGKKVIGMLVDRVSQVIRLPLKTVEAAPEEVSDSEKGFVTGVGKINGRLILLLALDRVLGR
ncbi:MAG TPA: chemotaxis protein CheW [Nitrospirota bacterium]|jgi:purine-binding chemotaxis protein CheW